MIQSHPALCALLCTTLTLAPLAAVAHPHVFVDTEVDVVTDAAGRVTGVRVTWTYDDFFSFLLTEELGLDPEGDMVLTPDEIEVLGAYVLDWPPEFGGDLHVSVDNRPLDLGPPQQAGVELVAGRVRETHIRPVLANPGPERPVVIQVYDPFYYTAYDVLTPVGVLGDGRCATELVKADIAAAATLVEEELFGRPPSDFAADEEFPEVGYAFSDRITVTCASSS